MSSHSGTIGRKRGGSSGGSEYYFGAGSATGSGVVSGIGGEQKMRRQRSAEWHSRYGYSSSEDEYQNTGQASAFDTQLLATLLLQSQQLANMDRYNSDGENEGVTTSLLTEYPRSSRDSADPSSGQFFQPHHQTQPQSQHRLKPQAQTTGLCSPGRQQAASSTSSTNLAAAVGTTNNNNKYQGRSTNPFLSSRYDSPSNSDSLSERASYSGSAAMLDRLQLAETGGAFLVPHAGGNGSGSGNGTISGDGTGGGNGTGCGTGSGSGNGAAAGGVSASTTASSLQQQQQNPSALGRENSSLRTSRSRSGRLNRTGGMTSSSSGASSNGNPAAAPSSSAAAAAVASAVAAALANRSEREKLKLQQIQMELREFAQSEGMTSSSSAAAAAAATTTAPAATTTTAHFGTADEDDSALSIGESEPPPEPAPPEIPPRTQSLLMSLRKSMNFKLDYEEKGDQKHEEFIPASQLQQLQQQHQLQRDYLIADNSRSSESQSKSIASSDSPSQHGPLPVETSLGLAKMVKKEVVAETVGRKL